VLLVRIENLGADLLRFNSKDRDRVGKHQPVVQDIEFLALYLLNVAIEFTRLPPVIVK
jgi:hypothetical protein